jgi:two-component system, NarL family, response regulator LiaR
MLIGGKEMTIHVLLADDHSMVREGLRLFLERDPELEIIAEATDGAEAVDVTRQLHPDVILMDILMPIMDGISATALILQEMPAIKIIVLTNVLEHSSVVRAVKAGASGYLLKYSGGRALSRHQSGSHGTGPAFSPGIGPSHA